MPRIKPRPSVSKSSIYSLSFHTFFSHQILFINQWLLIRGDFIPQGSSGLSPETYLAARTTGERPGMLLNIAQCTGQPPTTKNYPAPNINRADNEKPCSIDQVVCGKPAKLLWGSSSPRRSSAEPPGN